MRAEGRPLLKSVRPLDRYTGKQIPEGKVGSTYRCEYLDASRTLDETAITAVHTRIVVALQKKLGAQLR